MIRKVFVALALATAMMCSPAAKADDAPLQIGVTIWPGWMPWWIVEEKGYFDEVGVKAKIVKFKRHSDDMSAFAGKQLDATHMILADVIIPASKGVPGRIVLITDKSSGADGILAKTGIASIKDFKGKRVAYELGGVSQLILMRALEKEGLKLEDVTSVNMSAEDAGTAFLAGAVDVAVTWEPYLSQASKDGKGRVVFSTADTPGLVPDLLVVPRGNDRKALRRRAKGDRRMEQGARFHQDQPQGSGGDHGQGRRDQPRRDGAEPRGD